MTWTRTGRTRHRVAFWGFGLILQVEEQLRFYDGTFAGQRRWRDARVSDLKSPGA